MTSKIFKLLKIVQKRSNMISQGILHHLAKFQISWPSLTVILGNFQKLEQDENFFTKVVFEIYVTAEHARENKTHKLTSSFKGGGDPDCFRDSC